MVKLMIETKLHLPTIEKNKYGEILPSILLFQNTRKEIILCILFDIRGYKETPQSRRKLWNVSLIDDFSIILHFAIFP